MNLLRRTVGILDYQIRSLTDKFDSRFVASEIPSDASRSFVRKVRTMISIRFSRRHDSREIRRQGILVDVRK